LSDRPADRFDAGWLGLREPVDHRSRHEPFVTLLEAEGRTRGWRSVLDLGGGTGSNLRYLGTRLRWAESWCVLDHDPQLLARVHTFGPTPVRRLLGDLAQEGIEAVQEADLVTGSALLDLVSREWLVELAARCAGRGAGVLFSLNYDGSVALHGRGKDPGDAFVVDAVNEHQTGEKGMGPALGPTATRVAVEVFEAVGYRCVTAPSPWILSGAGDAPLARLLMEGWVEAAEALHPAEAPRLRAWLARRCEEFPGGLEITVGHQDLLALPDPAGR
jgi:hypothetical protein